MKLLQRMVPPPKPKREDCFFYHSCDFPNEEFAEGQWDLRGRFDEYVGNYPLNGKTVLDVGTASGFLSFSAEAAGARSVTSLDLLDASEFDRVSFAGSLYHVDRAAWDGEHAAPYCERLKNGYWYAWYAVGSKATVSYMPLRELPYYDEMFDVVIAGAIIEHLADPVDLIAALCRKATEAVIIAFTPVINESEPLMRPMSSWDDPKVDYVWWWLSRGLYERVFKNLGFAIELLPARATCNLGVVREEERVTIVARRVSGFDVKASRSDTLRQVPAPEDTPLQVPTPEERVIGPRPLLRRQKLHRGWRLIREGLGLRRSS